MFHSLFNIWEKLVLFRARMSLNAPRPRPPRPRRSKNGNDENEKKPRRGHRKDFGLVFRPGRPKSWPKWPKCRPFNHRRPQHHLLPELRRHPLLQRPHRPLLWRGLFARTLRGRRPTIGSPTTTGWSPSSFWPSRFSSIAASDLDNLPGKWKVRFHEKKLQPLWCVFWCFFLVCQLVLVPVEAFLFVAKKNRFSLNIRRLRFNCFLLWRIFDEQIQKYFDQNLVFLFGPSSLHAYKSALLVYWPSLALIG